jgi:hypothetical protein
MGAGNSLQGHICLERRHYLDADRPRASPGALRVSARRGAASARQGRATAHGASAGRAAPYPGDLFGEARSSALAGAVHRPAGALPDSPGMQRIAAAVAMGAGVRVVTLHTLGHAYTIPLLREVDAHPLMVFKLVGRSRGPGRRRRHQKKWAAGASTPRDIRGPGKRRW